MAARFALSPDSHWLGEWSQVGIQLLALSELATNRVATARLLLTNQVPDEIAFSPDARGAYRPTFPGLPIPSSDPESSR